MTGKIDLATEVKIREFCALVVAHFQLMMTVDLSVPENVGRLENTAEELDRKQEDLAYLLAVPEFMSDEPPVFIAALCTYCDRAGSDAASQLIPFLPKIRAVLDAMDRAEEAGEVVDDPVDIQRIIRAAVAARENGGTGSPAPSVPRP